MGIMVWQTWDWRIRQFEQIRRHGHLIASYRMADSSQQQGRCGKTEKIVHQTRQGGFTSRSRQDFPVGKFPQTSPATGTGRPSGEQPAVALANDQCHLFHPCHGWAG